MKNKTVSEYVENDAFWTSKGDQFTVIGDWLGRKPAVELLAARKGEQVLDAGCGQGIVTRMIASSGATVIACDRDERMLAAAQAEEKAEPLGISYFLADIAHPLRLADQLFDAVMCVAVLIHDTEKEVRDFLTQARRLVKPGGRLVVSVMHPLLYRSDSPTRTGQAGEWRHIPLDPSLDWEKSQLINELYPSTAFPEPFDSHVWHHTDTSYLTWIRQAGFVVSRVQENYMTPEVLLQINERSAPGRKPYGDAVDYPAFWQVLASTL